MLQAESDIGPSPQHYGPPAFTQKMQRSSCPSLVRQPPHGLRVCRELQLRSIPFKSVVVVPPFFASIQEFGPWRVTGGILAKDSARPCSPMPRKSLLLEKRRIRTSHREIEELDNCKARSFKDAAEELGFEARSRPRLQSLACSVSRNGTPLGPLSRLEVFPHHREALLVAGSKPRGGPTCKSMKRPGDVSPVPSVGWMYSSWPASNHRYQLVMALLAFPRCSQR